MTKRRGRLLAGLAALAMLGVLALPSVHWRLIGWWRGEPFYQRRPASYWAAELRAVDLASIDRGNLPDWAVGGVAFRKASGPKAWLRERLGYPPFYETVSV